MIQNFSMTSVTAFLVPRRSSRMFCSRVREIFGPRYFTSARARELAARVRFAAELRCLCLRFALARLIRLVPRCGMLSHVILQARAIWKLWKSVRGFGDE